MRHDLKSKKKNLNKNVTMPSEEDDQGDENED
jgi:hypothetical protein